jgi:hypothetical protein
MYSVSWSYAAANRGNLTWSPRVNGTLAHYHGGGNTITKLGSSFFAYSVIILPPTNDGGEHRLSGMPCSGLGSPSILRTPSPLYR